MMRRPLVLLVAALVAAAAVAAGLLLRRSTPAPPPNVLLISIDTLRADRLGSYGHAEAQTPVLDALAARGLRFADVTTVQPLTLPAHASLFTGTFPMFHGVRDNGAFYLGDDQITLAEVLRGRGYDTAGFVAAFVLDRRWGIAQGFDHYVDDFDMSKDVGLGMDAIQRRGGEVVDFALAWLRQPRDRPFFAFVHLYDPHTPYDAPEPFRSRFPRTMSGAYDAEVAYVDAQIGRLLDGLAAAGQLDDTLVIAVADHGESLGQHGEQAHGFFIYDATVRIPLIIAGPGIPAGVIDDPVRIVDVKPTLLDLLRAPVPDAVQGVSLLPAVRGERLELLGYAESWYPRHHYGWSELKAVRDDRYKFVLAPRRELYDLQRDPGETRNLAAEHPGRADALEGALRDLVARTASAGPAEGPRRVDPEVEERLRALGYVGATVSARHLEDRPRGDPKDKIGLYNLLKQAGQASVEDRVDEAVRMVRRALVEDPEVIQGHVMLGNLHTKAGRHEDAVSAYRQALALDPENPGAALSLAAAYRALGRLDDAEIGLERARELDPRGGKAQFQLADLLMRKGEFERAEALLREALDLQLERPTVLLKLGECYLEMRRLDEAERTLREAIAAREALPRARYNLGLVYEERRQTARAMAEYEAELERFPDNFSASFNLGKLLARAGRDAEALARFQQAVTSNPEFGTGHLYLAKALLDAGDLPSAERAARKGIAADPDPKIAPLGHYVLADIYSRRGRPEAAAREVALARRLEAGL